MLLKLISPAFSYYLKITYVVHMCGSPYISMEWQCPNYFYFFYYTLQS